MDKFKKYNRVGVIEMREYVLGEDLTGISVSDVDNPETDMGMIARNLDNINDMWYVARKYFENNYQENIQENCCKFDIDDELIAYSMSINEENILMRREKKILKEMVENFKHMKLFERLKFLFFGKYLL